MAFENDASGLLEDDGEYICDNKTDENVEKFNLNYETAPMAPEQEPAVKANKWALRGRLRSKVLWASIVGCIMTVFSILNVWEKIGITAEGFREIVGALGAVLSAFGVFNDPTNKEGF